MNDKVFRIIIMKDGEIAQRQLAGTMQIYARVMFYRQLCERANNDYKVKRVNGEVDMWTVSKGDERYVYMFRQEVVEGLAV